MSHDPHRAKELHTMAYIPNAPSVVAAAEARRMELLAEAERARLIALARASAPPRPRSDARTRCGAALIRLGQWVAATTEVPVSTERAPVPGAQRT
jgi:hypothetical protein